MGSGVKTALVIVSHSETLARGVVELASQMAADVRFLPAAGREDGGIGTSYERIETAVAQARGDDLEVVILTDLGSATMTVESVMEFYEDEPVYFADAPLVEGAVSAAVAAQQGKDGRGVYDAALEACRMWSASQSAKTPAPGGDADDFASARLEVGEPEGLHARPAALLAQMVNASGTEVTVNGVEANSVLTLMAAGIRHGDSVEVQVRGPNAAQVLEQISAKITGGFCAS